MEEFDKKEENREENKETNIMSSLLVAMTDLQKLMTEQNQLLTSLNTGLGKNTIITDELVFCQRNTERMERDQNLSASSYRARVQLITCDCYLFHVTDSQESFRRFTVNKNKNTLRDLDSQNIIKCHTMHCLGIV